MKCRFCGEELFPNYKGRPNNWKCPKCSRWLIGRETRRTKPARKSGSVVENRNEKEALDKMGWEEKSAGKVTFDKVNQELVGRITEIKPTELGVNSFTLVDASDGELKSFLGTTVLDRVLANELNSVVKIVYLGTARTGRGFNVKQFRVLIWKEEEGEEAPTGTPEVVDGDPA